MTWLTLALLLQAAGQQPPAPSEQLPVIEETVEVVAVTPVHGLGVPSSMVPANVQVLSAADVARRPGSTVTDVLASRLASVHLNEAQNNPFQADLQFRGFTVSPLLGLPQGVAVYLDGVRANEPFGDTVNWDLVPTGAIASANVVPGSNPLFGLNALGGALSLETKTGFTSPGHAARVFGGSFARQWLEVASGGYRRNVSYFLSAHALAEDGWRDHSPTRTGQFFGNVEWRGTESRLAVSVVGGLSRLIGNGAAPVDLLEVDRRAVFTHVDRTSTRAVLVTVRGSRALGSGTLDGVFYVRPARIQTFNGDDTTYGPCEDDDLSAFICDDEGEGDLVETPGGQFVPADDDAAYDGTNNYSTTRTGGWGGTLQTSSVTTPRGRENRFIAGLSFDRAGSRYSADTEIANLTATRGTVGTGIFDGEAAVRLRSTATHAGAYVANYFRVVPRVTLSGSARFTRSWISLRDGLGDDLTGDHAFARLNPSAGVTIDAGAGVTAFMSYGQSSRVPTPSELGCADPEDPCRLPNAFVADPPLDEVVARSLEGGARGRAGGVNWTLSVFRTAIADDIIFVSSGALTNSGHFENIGDTSRKGVELAASGTAGRVSWAAAYTHLRARFDSPLTLSSPNHPDGVDGEIDVPAGSWIPGVPRHNLKGEVASTIGRLMLHGETNFVSSFYLRGDEANLLEPIDRRTIVNAGASWRLNPRLQLIGRITNVFNAEYSSFGLLGEADEVLGDDFEDPRFEGPGAPRAAWIGLEMSFR
jgi:iron complex outermembrane recepter protein